MVRVNWARIILGGLLAGLVLNVGEYLLNNSALGEQWQNAMSAMNLAQPGGSAIAVMVVWMFLVGIYIVGLYAAIRPRYGAGPKTALCTGLAVWLIYCVLGFGSTLIMGMFPAKLVLTAVAWELVEMPLAALAGAWLYKEETGPAAGQA